MELLADGGLLHLDEHGIGVVEKVIVQHLAPLEFFLEQLLAQTVGIAWNLHNGAESRRIGEKRSQADDPLVSHDTDFDRVAFGSAGQIGNHRGLRKVNLGDSFTSFIEDRTLFQDHRFELR